MNNRYEDSDWSTALIDMINRPGVQREIEEADFLNSENTATERSVSDATTQMDE